MLGFFFAFGVSLFSGGRRSVLKGARIVNVVVVAWGFSLGLMLGFGGN